MADYLAIQADETTGTATHCQLVMCYVAFYKFIQLPDATVDTVATAVLERLKTILPEGQWGKLPAQVYDGAAVMRGATGGVQRNGQDVYGRPHYVHCYAHQLILIMQQATSLGHQRSEVSCNSVLYTVHKVFTFGIFVFNSCIMMTVSLCI